MLQPKYFSICSRPNSVLLNSPQRISLVAPVRCRVCCCPPHDQQRRAGIALNIAHTSTIHLHSLLQSIVCKGTSSGAPTRLPTCCGLRKTFPFRPNYAAHRSQTSNRISSIQRAPDERTVSARAEFETASLSYPARADFSCVSP